MIRVGDSVILKFSEVTGEIKRYDGKVYAYESMENAKRNLKRGEPNAILMEYVPKPQWIPISEKLPDRFQMVLLWDAIDGDAFMGSLEFGDKWHIPGYERETFDITHWMPFPGMPKE